MCGFPPVHQVLGVAGRTTIAGGFLFSETETSDSSDPVSKGSLRRTMRQQRRTLSPQHLQQAALALSRQILQLSHYKKAQRIALYWPMQGEINPLPLMYHRLSRHKQFYLPVLSGSFAQKLRFAPFHGESRMRPNGFRIPEPQVAADLLMTPQDLDLLILPWWRLIQKVIAWVWAGDFMIAASPASPTVSIGSTRACWGSAMLFSS